MKHRILSSSHRRSLSAVARSIEQSLNDIYTLLNDDRPDTVLHRIEKSYEKKQRQEIISSINSLKKILNEMINHFNLDTSSVTEKQIINAKLAHIWTLLHDSYSKKIVRYGKIDKETSIEIDKYIDKMLNSLSTLQKISSLEDNDNSVIKEKKNLEY